MEAQLGQQLRSIDLRPAPPIKIGVAAIIVLAIAIAAFLIAPPIGLLALGTGILIITLGAIIFYVLTLNDLKKVVVYENGFLATVRRSTQVVLWRDVVGIQLNQVSDVYYESPLTVPVVFPGVLILFGALRIGGGIKHRHECRYVFRLADHARFELKSDARLFDLVNDIKAKVFSKITPEIIRQFNNGDAIPLIDGVTYSKNGIAGVLVRQTSHSRREIPLSLGWSDIERLSRSTEQFTIKPENGQSIYMPMADIINAPVFLKILSNLCDEGVVPPVN